MNALLSLRDTAKLLSVSTWTIRNFVRSGRLVPVRLCRRLLFEETDVARFIQQSKISPMGSDHRQFVASAIEYPMTVERKDINA